MIRGQNHSKRGEEDKREADREEEGRGGGMRRLVDKAKNQIVFNIIH